MNRAPKADFDVIIIGAGLSGIGYTNAAWTLRADLISEFI